MLGEGEDTAVSGDDPIYKLALATASEIGDEFLSSLVRSLHDVMPVTLAFIARSSGDPAFSASATTCWRDGGLGDPINYELEGTPCKLLYGGKTLIIPSGLVEKFPEKKDHESYCGVPLRLSGGKICGHFAVFSPNVIDNPQQVEGIVRIFGMRAETELRRLEADAERDAMLRRLRDQRAALHVANNFKSSAIGMVAHDLRNPLATIVARTELVQMMVSKQAKVDPATAVPEMAAKIEKSIETVLSSTDRMTAMINNLLDAAKVELGSIKVNKSPVQVSIPTIAAVEVVSAQARAKKIEIELDPIADGVIGVDETRLTEMLVNLLTNAIKYSQSKTKIIVSFEVFGDEQGVGIVVRDEGLGMTPADVTLAFQPFQVLSAKPTAGESSTGLGLVMVKSVVEAHGGTVSIRSDGPGTGTEFSVWLPQ